MSGDGAVAPVRQDRSILKETIAFSSGADRNGAIVPTAADWNVDLATKGQSDVCFDPIVHWNSVSFDLDPRPHCPRLRRATTFGFRRGARCSTDAQLLDPVD